MRAPLVGHSMGGTVSLSVAIQYPERVQKVVVIGSPIVGSARSLAAEAVRPAPGRLRGAITTCGGCELGFRILAPFYSRDPRWSEMMDRDISQTTLESFLTSIASLRQTDLRPTLAPGQRAGHGHVRDKDIVVHPDQWQADRKRASPRRASSASQRRAFHHAG